ncbi:VOC family protein [Undibacterium fentianense]|uniref:VOC family protein n=1 Tax=Undibacterium fentianense TaxID=2828728 RepID=A0A941IFA9_9BURK|nr:VOC family protein [Undibacterium fentianense]MBR7800521.1 VOC family protein [Undibacterium fentianense]
MAKVSTYLNFPGTTEQAFLFYREVFGGDFLGPIMRFTDIPPQPGQALLSEQDRNLILHIELPILGGHVIMATDASESMGFRMKYGNNMSINLEPDTRAETERLFQALSHHADVEMPLTDMFWGAYFGTLADQFGVRWMFNCEEKKV